MYRFVGVCVCTVGECELCFQVVAKFFKLDVAIDSFSPSLSLPDTRAPTAGHTPPTVATLRVTTAATGAAVPRRGGTRQGLVCVCVCARITADFHV